MTLHVNCYVHEVGHAYFNTSSAVGGFVKTAGGVGNGHFKNFYKWCCFFACTCVCIGHCGGVELHIAKPVEELLEKCATFCTEHAHYFKIIVKRIIIKIKN